MESLDEILLRIDVLERDLNANLQIGHWEHIPAREGGWIEAKRHLDWYEGQDEWVGPSEAKDEFVVDSYEPDTPKRDAAKVELQKINKTSDWFSARYKSGMSLGLHKEIECQLPLWLAKLKEYLQDQTVLQEEESHTDTFMSDTTGDYASR